METRLLIERSLGMLLVVLGVWMAWDLQIAGYVTLAFGVLVLMIWVSGSGLVYEAAQKAANQPPPAEPPDEDI